MKFSFKIYDVFDELAETIELEAKDSNEAENLAKAHMSKLNTLPLKWEVTEITNG